MDAIEAFEVVGEMFYRDTGLLRPGKSYPLAMLRPEDLEEQFDKWAKANLAHIRAVWSFVQEPEEE